jgi:hypothetical protein
LMSNSAMELGIYTISEEFWCLARWHFRIANPCNITTNINLNV